MNEKLKITAVSLAMATFIGLTACGGGSDSGTSIFTATGLELDDWPDGHPAGVTL